MTSRDDLDRELLSLLLKRINNEKLLKAVFYRLETAQEKEAMVSYLKKYPEATPNDLNYESVSIVLSRWNKENRRSS